MAQFRRLPWAALGLLAIWCAGTGYGFLRLVCYDATPGASAASLSDWPRDVNALNPSLRLAESSAKTLVVFVHPQCPCTSATIGNLAVALAHESSPSAVRAYVVFYEPYAHAGSDWEKSGLLRAALRLPNVEVMFDPAGLLARRFGAQTSGQTFVYDAAGQLLFNGGVTDQRGHYGDSDGGDAVAALASGSVPKSRVTPVYGCSLLPARAVQPLTMPGMSMTLPLPSNSSAILPANGDGATK